MPVIFRRIVLILLSISGLTGAVRTIIHARSHEAPDDVSDVISAELRASVVADEGGDDSSSTVFRLCGHQCEALKQVTRGTVKLNDIGKLAKGGNFLVSDDRSIIVKKVDSAEDAVLRRWTATTLETDFDGGCDAFSSSLLVPVHLAFNSNVNGEPYHVMENETLRLENDAGNGWHVASVYDIKPLPNLSKGLAQLLKAMLKGFGRNLPPWKSWQGWEAVRQLLERDLHFLKQQNIIDFSLFVHLLLPTTNDAILPSGLSAKDGCLHAPNGDALLCFSIIDYFVEQTWKRNAESSMKGHKFYNYTGKMAETFECLGDLDNEECDRFRELNTILQAAEQSKAKSKAAFIGLDIFKDAYECQGEAPQMLYQVMNNQDHHNPLEPDRYVERQSFMHKYAAYDGGANQFSERIQELADPANGAQVVGSNFSDELLFAQMRGFERFEEGSATLRDVGNAQFSLCQQSVEEFSTETTFSWADPTRDQGNIMYNPEADSVVVVRGAPSLIKGILTLYPSHSNAVARARQRLCFLRMDFYRCRPKAGGNIQFDYKHKFGKLEVMVMSMHDYDEEQLQHYVNGVDSGEQTGTPIRKVMFPPADIGRHLQ